MNTIAKLQLTKVETRVATEVLVNNGGTLSLDLNIAVHQASLYNLMYMNIDLSDLSQEDKSFLSTFIAGYSRLINTWDLIRFVQGANDLAQFNEDRPLLEDFVIESFNYVMHFHSELIYDAGRANFVVNLSLSHQEFKALYSLLKRIEALSQQDKNKDSQEAVKQILDIYLPALSEYFLPTF